MSDCINCQCEEIVPGSTACASLKKQNDDRIKLHSLVLRDTTLCDLPEQTSKAFYSQWCFNKNLTSQVCWLMNNSSGGKTYKAGKDISISMMVLSHSQVLSQHLLLLMMMLTSELKMLDLKVL